MPDEHDQNEESTNPVPEPDETGGCDGSEETGGQTDQDRESVEELDDTDEQDQNPANDAPDDRPAAAHAATAPQAALRIQNMATVGQLTLHYAERDVTVLLDGDAAVRLLTMFARRAERGLADRLDPERSRAANGWVVLDLQEPLAMSWLPGLPSRPPRTAVDPALSA